MTIIGGCDCSGPAGCPLYQWSTLQASYDGRPSSFIDAPAAFAEWDSYDLGAILPTDPDDTIESLGTWTSGGGFAYSTGISPVSVRDCGPPPGLGTSFAHALARWRRYWDVDIELVANRVEYFRLYLKLLQGAWGRLWSHSLIYDGYLSETDSGWVVAEDWTWFDSGTVLEIAAATPPTPPSPPLDISGPRVSVALEEAVMEFALTLGGGCE